MKNALKNLNAAVIPGEVGGSRLRPDFSVPLCSGWNDAEGGDRFAKIINHANELNESRLWKIKISYQKRWTKHRRTQKSLEIQTTEPWRRATGPKTPAGKSRMANNAGKGQGRNAYNRLVAKIMSDHSRFLRETLMACGARPWDGRKPLKTIRECVEEAALHEIRLAALAATQNVNFLKVLTIVTQRNNE